MEDQMSDAATNPTDLLWQTKLSPLTPFEALPVDFASSIREESFPSSVFSAD
jgi:hypothetical protein